MKNLYEKGLGFRSFMLNMEKDIRSKFMKYYIPINISVEHREKINSVKENIRVLGIIDEKCPDCHINLPVLEKLVCTNNNIDLRLITRDYLEGETKVPTFIFMDNKYKVIGEFIERPKTVKKADINTAEGSQIYMQYTAGKLAGDTADEFMGIIMTLDSNNM